MRDSVCPKCGSTNVHLQTGAGGIRPIGIGNGTSADVNAYVCAHCGYLEYYVEDGQALRALAKSWPRVTPPRVKIRMKT